MPSIDRNKLVLFLAARLAILPSYSALYDATIIIEEKRGIDILAASELIMKPAVALALTDFSMTR